MAYNSGNPDNTAFPGFPGGYDAVPGVGNVAPATVGTLNTGFTDASTLGSNLPHVNPNTFPGVVHWGQEQTISGVPPGQLQPGAGLGGAGVS